MLCLESGENSSATVDDAMSEIFECANNMLWRYAGREVACQRALLAGCSAEISYQ